MTLLAVPNISEGVDRDVIGQCIRSATSAGAKLLDTHIDPVHNRTVLTIAGNETELVEGSVQLAHVATTIDLQTHSGVHPRLGGLDVCPFVPHAQTGPDVAVAAARSAALRIGTEVGVPVFLYGWAASRPESKELPGLRRGGLGSMVHRIQTGLAPDAGPGDVDPARGVVCVGARGPLIAFNVWIEAPRSDASRIAAEVRSRSIRSLGLPMGDGLAQVSMNLIDPASTGIEAAFEAVAKQARAAGVRLTATEIVGLVERRFLPNPGTTAARLLLEPGRTVEDALERVS